MDSITQSPLNMAALRELIRTVLSLPEGSVRDPRLNGEIKPGESFITVNPIYSRSYGVRVEMSDANQGTPSHEQLRESLLTTISVQAYGRAANAVLRKLAVLRYSSTFQSAIHRLGASVYSLSDIRDVTMPIGTRKEERAQCDLQLLHEHVVSVPVLAIEHVSWVIQAESSPEQIVRLHPVLNRTDSAD